MAEPRFHGGPCDGSTTLRDPGTATFTCEGHLYFRGADGDYYATASAAGGASVGRALDTQQIGKAWHRFMHALAADAPQTIRRSRLARGRMRRAVR